MVELPEVVGVETVTIDGKTVVKQKYGDGSYGIVSPSVLGGNGVEIHYPNKDVRTFYPHKEGGYYLAYEKLNDGTKRGFNENGIMYYEKLPNGEERSWDIFFNKAYIRKEVIPGEPDREYHLTGKFSRRGRLIPGTEYNYLFEEKYKDGTVIQYYPSKTEKLKSYEKLPNGTERNFYPNGNLQAEKLPGDNVSRTYYEDGVTLSGEDFPNGDYIQYYEGEGKRVELKKTGNIIETYHEDGVTLKTRRETSRYGSIKEEKEWDKEGRIVFEHRKDGTRVDYKYDENGNLNYHAVNGVEDTVKYLAMKKVAARQAQKSEKLREQHVEYTDANGNVREKQAVEKLKPLQKTVQMLKAMREVKKSLKR